MKKIKTTLNNYIQLIQNKELTALSLVSDCISKLRRYNKKINCMLYIDEERAIAEAKLCDAEAANGNFRGRLHGIPIVVKDNINVQGMPTTVAASIFSNSNPKDEDAAVIARLRAEGAIIIGKTNMDEFAAHVSGRTSCAGPSINPWGAEKNISPGGSSSGSAASVAAGCIPIAIGTDTGGSVRLPAAWCGLCGIRPSHGLVSLNGVYPRASSLDTVGVFADSAYDIAIVLEIMSGQDLNLKKSCIDDWQKPKIGFSTDIINSSSEIMKKCYDNIIQAWTAIAKLIQVKFKLLEEKEAASTINMIRSYEFARDTYNNIEKYKNRKDKINDVARSDYINGQKICFEKYISAIKKAKKFSVMVDAFMKKHELDFLLLPVARMTAPDNDAPAEVFTSARDFLNLFSMTGHPTLIMPGCLIDGMPFGVQIIGKLGRDNDLLELGMQYEKNIYPFPKPK